MRLPFLLALVACGCPAQDAARLDAIVQSSAASGKFMGSVLVARDDRVLLSKGYGFANLEWKVPNTPQTKFRLGSITKQFTAAAILLLEERGKLATSDPVSKFVTGAPASWHAVTLFHLLTHSSGIPSFTEFPDYIPLKPFPTTPEKLVARFRDKKLEFQPGEKWKYSNSGYVLLGYVIERAGGRPYAEFVRENLFAPLGMADSGYDSTSAVIPRRASGYSPGEGGPSNAGYIDMSIPHGAGALYSTTEDLLKWERALFGGKVLSAASLRKMTTPFKNDYAFGLQVREQNGRKVIRHNGGIDGFETSLAYFPDDKLIVAVLANMNGSRPDSILAKLAAAAQGERAVLPSGKKTSALRPR